MKNMRHGDDEDAFIAAINEAPADAAPRLVYADWLDEQGDERSALDAKAERHRAKLAAEGTPFEEVGSYPITITPGDWGDNWVNFRGHVGDRDVGGFGGGYFHTPESAEEENQRMNYHSVHPRRAEVGDLDPYTGWEATGGSQPHDVALGAGLPMPDGWDERDLASDLGDELVAASRRLVRRLKRHHYDLIDPDYRRLFATTDPAFAERWADEIESDPAINRTRRSAR